MKNLLVNVQHLSIKKQAFIFTQTKQNKKHDFATNIYSFM